MITVALLFGTGLVASLAGRARRRQTVEAVGRLIVTFRQGEWIPPIIRLALVTVAHALATTTGPAVSRDQ